MMKFLAILLLHCYISLCRTKITIHRSNTDIFEGVECKGIRESYELNRRTNCSCKYGETLLSVGGKLECLNEKHSKECSNFVVLPNGLSSKILMVQRLFSTDCVAITVTEFQWWNYKKENQDQVVEQGVWEDYEELKNQIKIKNGSMELIESSKYNFEGLVLKLVLSCQLGTSDTDHIDEECVMIKIPGIRQYPLSKDDLLAKATTTAKTTTFTRKVTTAKNTSTTTTSTTTSTREITKSTEPLARKDKSESDNQTLVIGILIPVILLLLVIIIILIIIKRKRTKKDQSGEQPSTIKPTTQKLVPPPTHSAQPNPYTFDDHDYKELESEYAPSSVASTNQGFIGTSPQRSVLNEQNDTYSDLSPKYQGRSDIYTGLNNDSVIYNELEINPTAPNNNSTAPIDETHYHEVDEIDKDNYYSAVAGQPHVSPPPYAKVQKHK